jgi:alkylation response protein AidB-like acyl-CoA dehydrogenase
MTATKLATAKATSRDSIASQGNGGDGVREQLMKRVHEIGPILREHSAEAERQRRLPAPALEALRGAGLLRLFTPHSLGGLEVDPVTCARVVEEVAGFDSTAAWALQSGNVNAWWTCRLPDDGAEVLYGSSPSVMVAAALHPPQQAFEVPGGYKVSGGGPLASFIHDCDWVLVSAFIMEGDRPRMTEFGPQQIAILLPKADVRVIDTWHALGMRGTDSNDVAFNDVVVPAHLTFPFAPTFEPGRHFGGPLYQFPGAAIVALFSVAILLATARGALTEFRELAQRKTPFGSMKTLRDRGTVQATFAEAEGILRSARALFYETLSETWARAAAGVPNTMEQKADLLLAGVHAARSSAKVTELMHRLAGTTGIYAKSPLERYFRDVQTLRHHGFVSEGKLESVGQIYLGLPPDFPLVAL